MISDHPGGGAETPPVDGERITGTSHGDPHQQPIDGDAPKLDRAQRRAGSLGLLRYPAEICS
jgi:hypothetical protein